MSPPRPGPFELHHNEALPHGIMVAVSIPDSPEPAPESILRQLHPDEREHARALRGYTQGQWVGARLAAAHAARQLGIPLGPLLNDERGAPLVSPQSGLAVSISHKRDLAVALVARASNGSVGVDVEDFAPARMSVAERVLTSDELREVMSLPEERRWGAVVMRFSVKEAIYKALAPTLRRYIEFGEAEVMLEREGLLRVRLNLAKGEVPPALEARIAWLPGRVLSTVRARWS